MTNNDHESTLLNESTQLSFELLAELSGLTLQELQLLVNNGALIPSHVTETSDLRPLSFNSHYLISIRKLYRLKQDLELDTHSLSITLVLLERVRVLELQLRQLSNQTIGNVHDDKHA